MTNRIFYNPLNDIDEENSHFDDEIIGECGVLEDAFDDDDFEEFEDWDEEDF